MIFSFFIRPGNCPIFGKTDDTLKKIPCQESLSYDSISSMDITILNKNSLRIKSKTAALVIDPDSTTGKIEADAILSLTKSSDFSDRKIEGARIIINGAGEYEVGGIKITAMKAGNGLVANLDVEEVKVLLGKGTEIEKIQDKIEECDIVLVNSDEEFNYSILTALEPKVLVVYGEKKEDLRKSLGKEGVKVSKYSTTSEKLPAEMEMVFLE